MKLTPLAKGIVTVMVFGVLGGALYLNRESIAPSAKGKVSTNVPPSADLPLSLIHISEPTRPY